MLELHDVMFEYRSGRRIQPALRNVSLQVRSEEFVAVVGPSGCGKSTLLNLIGGFEMPTNGQVLVDGLPVTRPGADRMMIFQKSALFPFLTVLENVQYGLNLRRMNVKDLKPRALKALESVGLAGFAAVYPKELSHGMRKMAEIARALVLEAPLLLFDESLGNLDALSRIHMQQLLQQLWIQHRPTVLWVTHDLEEAVMLADKIVVLSHRPGCVVAVIDVPFPRPRNDSVRTSRELQLLRQRLFKHLSVEPEHTRVT
jgi:NitT/TauT family transport system ATP-binding protein